jgi:uncharacterized repeat protein (TIGR03806 family)
LRRAFLSIFFVLAACSGEQAPEPRFHADGHPETLSEWGVLSVQDGALRLSAGVAPYDLATPLFSDYAQKLRTVWTPDGQAAIYNPSDAFDFPIGTIVTKTFYYPVTTDGAVAAGPARTVEGDAMALDDIRLMETRVLARRADGWIALPYIWDEAQTEAVLKRTGAVKPLTLVRDDGRREDFAYLVPNQNQCAACHVTNAETKAIQPIGLKARHLNKTSTFHPAFNQLDYWIAAGLVTADNVKAAPKNAVWTDDAAPLKDRARAYLDINCSHCHNPNGAADTSGLNLEPDATGPALGLCKPPIAAGGGTGGRAFSIVPGAPDRSITVFRMETNDPGAMMPELGRAVAHEEGVALIRDWIAAMDGAC